MNTRGYTFLFTLSVSFIIYFSSCSSNEETAQVEPKINVEVAQVIQKSMALPINTSGKLYASTESKLSFKIPGIVAHIFANKGQAVKKGSLLAELDLIEMKAKVSQARSGQQKAQRDLERAQRLFADSVATLEQLQNATTALDIAESSLEVAEFNLRYSTIYAPESGKILKCFVEEGELIGSGHPVFLYGASKEGWVLRAGVTDQQIIQLQVGDKATIIFDAYPGVEFPARVSEIEAVANPYTGTFEVELQLNPSKLQLYSGFVGKVTIIPSITQKYSIIPIESLIEGDENNGFIFSVNRKNETVQKHEIRISKIFGNQLLVYLGLEDVDEVVTFGAPYLTGNSRINIIE